MTCVDDSIGVCACGWLVGYAWVCVVEDGMAERAYFVVGYIFYDCIPVSIVFKKLLRIVMVFSVLFSVTNL